MMDDEKVTASFLNTPRRQSASGVIVESVFALREVAKAAWPLIFLMIIKPEKFSLTVVMLIALLIVVITFIIGYLRFRNFVFFIDEASDDFVLEKGVFNKEKIIIQLNRIQQVNLSQNLVQKVLRVYAVDINTASTTKSEVKIKAVSREIALQLKSRLLSDSSAQTLPENAGEIHQQVQEGFRLSISTLAKVAVTSNYGKSFAVILAAIAGLYDSLRDFLSQSERGKEFLSKSFQLDSFLQNVVVLIAAAFLFLFLFNLVRVLVIFSDYKILFKKAAFSISYGLLNTRNIVVYVEKIQVVETVTNFLQKKMKLQRLFFYQASSDITSDKQAVIHVPGCTPQQEHILLNRVFKEIPPVEIVLVPNIRKIISPIIFLVIIPLIPFAFARDTTWFFNYLTLLPFWIILAVIIIFFRFKNSRLKVSKGFVQTTSGVWDITTRILQTYKIQAITVTQRLWHRKRNIGHITLHTAGGDVTFKFGDYRKLNALTNQWLYDVETSGENWM